MAGWRDLPVLDRDESNQGNLKAGFHWRRSRSRSHKLDEIGVGRIRTVSFSSDSAYDSDAYDPVKTRLSESQAEEEAQEPTNHNVGFILRLQLTTPTIKFSLDHKPRSHKQNRKKMKPF